MIKKWRVKFPAQKGYDRRWAYVYLPTEARRDSERRFPVLYMFDGHNVFYDEDATYGTGRITPASTSTCPTTSHRSVLGPLKGTGGRPWTGSCRNSSP